MVVTVEFLKFLTAATNALPKVMALRSLTEFMLDAGTAPPDDLAKMRLLYAQTNALLNALSRPPHL